MATHAIRRRRLRTVSFLSGLRRDRIEIAPRSGHRTLNRVHVLSRPEAVSLRRPYALPFSFSEVYDGRQDFFARSGGYSKTFTGVAARVGTPDRRTEAKLSKLYFFNPTRVVLCVRREQRRRVIFARGSAGSKVKPPSFSQDSLISCKS